MVHVFVGDRPTFTYNTSAQATGPGSARVTVPANVTAGDVLFYVNYATSGSAIPGPVIPPGFVNVINTSILAAGSSGLSVRVTGSYKLANGSDHGTTLGAMSGTGTAAILLCLKSSTGVFGTLNPQDIAQQTVRNATPAAQTINCASAILPLVGFGIAARSAVTSGLSMSPNNGIVSTGNVAVGFKIYNDAPSNISVSCPNSGAENTLASFFLTGDV